MPSFIKHALVSSVVCGSLAALSSAFPVHSNGAAVPDANERPIVGILTQPRGTERNSTNDGAYIAASYVKFVEMSGARVAPIFHFESEENITSMFHSVNGILLPGGGSNISAGTPLHSAGQLLYDLALKENDAGTVFPVWGTCMGFQFLNILTAGTEDVLCEACFTTEGIPMALNFTDTANSSYMMSALAELHPALYEATATEKLTANSHHDGVLLSTHESNSDLREFYDVLSTNSDPVNGRVFVSSMEAKKYPVLATQWHPEKNNFEWLWPGAVPHSSNAIRLSE